MIIDIDLMSCKIIQTEYNDAYYMDSVIADKQFHVICKVNSLNNIPNTNITTSSRLSGAAIHLQWSLEANTFEEIYQFEKGLNAFRPRPFIHFLKSKNSLLSICNNGNLYQYDMNNIGNDRKWKQFSFWATIDMDMQPLLHQMIDI